MNLLLLDCSGLFVSEACFAFRKPVFLLSCCSILFYFILFFALFCLCSKVSSTCSVAKIIVRKKLLDFFVVR